MVKSIKVLVLRAITRPYDTRNCPWIASSFPLNVLQKNLEKNAFSNAYNVHIIEPRYCLLLHSARSVTLTTQKPAIVSRNITFSVRAIFVPKRLALTSSASSTLCLMDLQETRLYVDQQESVTREDETAATKVHGFFRAQLAFIVGIGLRTSMLLNRAGFVALGIAGYFTEQTKHQCSVQTLPSCKH